MKHVCGGGLNVRRGGKPLLVGVVYTGRSGLLLMEGGVGDGAARGQAADVERLRFVLLVLLERDVQRGAAHVRGHWQAFVVRRLNITVNLAGIYVRARSRHTFETWLLLQRRCL